MKIANIGKDEVIETLQVVRLGLLPEREIAALHRAERIVETAFKAVSGNAHEALAGFRDLQLLMLPSDEVITD